MVRLIRTEPGSADLAKKFARCREDALRAPAVRCQSRARGDDEATRKRRPPIGRAGRYSIESIVGVGRDGVWDHPESVPKRCLLRRPRDPHPLRVRRASDPVQPSSADGCGAAVIKTGFARPVNRDSPPNREMPATSDAALDPGRGPIWPSREPRRYNSL